MVKRWTIFVHLEFLFFDFSFHEKDSPIQKILIENLSKYLLRKSYITNVLIGKFSLKFFKFFNIFFLLKDDLKQCFEGSNLSPTLLSTLVEQISRAIKECYHATPDGLLNLLFVGCDHHQVRQDESFIFENFEENVSKDKTPFELSFRLQRAFITCRKDLCSNLFVAEIGSEQDIDDKLTWSPSGTIRKFISFRSFLHTEVQSVDKGKTTTEGIASKDSLVSLIEEFWLGL